MLKAPLEVKRDNEDLQVVTSNIYIYFSLNECCAAGKETAAHPVPGGTTGARSFGVLPLTIWG